jgi:hypothetical protein
MMVVEIKRSGKSVRKQENNSEGGRGKEQKDNTSKIQTLHRLTLLCGPPFVIDLPLLADCALLAAKGDHPSARHTLVPQGLIH